MSFIVINLYLCATNSCLDEDIYAFNKESSKICQFTSRNLMNSFDSYMLKLHKTGRKIKKPSSMVSGIFSHIILLCGKTCSETYLPFVT